MELFKEKFSKMFNGSTMPDFGMISEHSELTSRYIGKGEEAFYYSICANSNCSDTDFEKAVHEEIDLARSRKRKSFEWKTFDLFEQEFAKKILKKHNFTLNRQSRLMFTKSDHVFTPAKNVNAVEVKNNDDFKKLVGLIEEVFDEDASWLNDTLRIELAAGHGLTNAYLAFVDGQLASAAWIKIYNEIAYLYGGGTLKELRGRGAYKKLLHARCKYALESNIEYVVSECSPDSEKVLRSLGFADAGCSYQWVYSF